MNFFAYLSDCMVRNLEEHRQVAIWLYIGVLMLIVQVLLGGITRLTGSGLSITEWQPILGFLPPMNEKAWTEAFEKYQEIGQFKKINSHFSLSDFKAIYFWEWFHREWARLIGCVFIFPFLYFLIKKKISRALAHPLLIIFLLGALQSMIGWVMVKSGLNVESTYVSHVRLAIHFIAAMLLLSYLFWFALKLSVPRTKQPAHSKLIVLNAWLLVLLFIQFIYGAFMAGLHAALAAPTWPLINGVWFPVMNTEQGFLSMMVHNPIAIQFFHRGLAYLIAVLVILWTFKALRLARFQGFYRIIFIPLLLIIAQIALGIFALLHAADPDSLTDKMFYGVMHQFVGMLLMLALLLTLHLSCRVGHK